MLRRLVVLAVLLSCTGGAPAPTSVPRAPTSGPPTPTESRSPTEAARPTPTPDPATLRTCAASQLQAVASWAETADALAGAVFIVNRGSEPCRLRGNPQVSLLAADGSPLEVRVAMVTGATGPPAVAVAMGQLRRDPAGLGGAGAVAPLRWTNYCDDISPATFMLTLPEDGGGLVGTFVDLTGAPVSTGPVPRCDDAAGPSTLAVYPFQEPRR